MHAGDPSARARVTVRVKEWRVFWRVLTSADIGAGEAYMEGDWECSDLVTLCRWFMRDTGLLQNRSPWTVPTRLAHAALRYARANTLSGSRRNITFHYDLSNELYRLFLDDSMTYSSAVFPTADSTLAEAQQYKIDGVCRQLALAPEHHLLEIGSGWGALAMHAARQYGCRVTSLTLSHQQLQLARQRVAAAGLGERVDVQLCDYRNVSGVYDRVVSIEMLEAVGHSFYGAFFGQCGRLLKPGGRMFLQSICVPDQRFDRYRRDFDWIRKYIFPGGALASVHAIATAVKTHTPMRIEWLSEIGPHYVPTLRLWRERFARHASAIRQLGFDDRFIRMWDFYLASCEAAFAERAIGNVQMVLAQP
jgi:cyclopropane-fatty-acyl-phospholipid synthase